MARRQSSSTLYPYSSASVLAAVAGTFDYATGADVALLYDYGAGSVRWHVWLSKPPELVGG